MCGCGSSAACAIRAPRELRAEAVSPHRPREEAARSRRRSCAGSPALEAPLAALKVRSESAARAFPIALAGHARANIAAGALAAAASCTSASASVIG